MIRDVAVQSSPAGIITATATMFIAATGLVTAVIGFFRVIKPVRQEQIRQGVVIDKSHEIVNSQRTAMQKYIQLLSSDLTAHGITVPNDESLEHGEQ